MEGRERVATLNTNLNGVTMARWYAVNTKARQEFAAREHLERQAYRTHLPLVSAPRRRCGRWQSGTEPLFPGYLFVELDMQSQNTAPIRSTRGVVGLVRFGNRLPPVPSGLIEALIGSQPDDEQPLDLSRLFRAGDPVAIVGGPFQGLQAIVEAPSTRDRVRVLLDLLGRASRVTLSSDQVAPLN
jgi:transcriptional antiterminator RfaH